MNLILFLSALVTVCRRRTSAALYQVKNDPGYLSHPFGTLKAREDFLLLATFGSFNLRLIAYLYGT